MLQLDLYGVKIGLFETTNVIACFKTNIAGRNWDFTVYSRQYVTRNALLVLITFAISVSVEIREVSVGWIAYE
jgi:hypothetical protein